MKDGDTYREGDNATLFVSKWDVTDENNRMTYDESLECYIKVYENVAKGEYHFKIAENKSWDVSFGHDGGNCYLKVEEDGSRVVITLKDGNVTCAATKVVKPEEKPTETPNETPETNPDNTPDKTPENTPDNTPEQKPEDKTDGPAVKLNFFQRIFLAIKTFFRRLFGIK